MAVRHSRRPKFGRQSGRQRGGNWDGGQAGREAEIRKALVSPVGTVAFSRDSRLLAVCTLEEGLSVWDLEEMTLASASKAETGGCPLSALFFPDPFQEESGREKRERDKEGVGGAHCSSTMMQRSFSASLSQVLSRSLQSREDLHEGVMRDRELRGTQSENQKRHSASARFVPSRPPNLPKPGRIPHHFLYTTNEDGMMRQWVIPDGKGKEGTEGGGKGAVDMFVRQRGSDGKVRLFDRHRKGGGSRKAAVLDPSARLPALPSFLSHERSALGLGDPPLPLQEALPPPTSVYQFPPRALTRRPDDPSTPRRMLSRTYSGWSRPPSPTSPGRTPAQRAAEDAVCLAEVLFFPRHPSLLLSLSAALNGPPHLSALRVFDLSRLPKSAADAGGLASSPLRLSVFCLPGRFTRAATGPSDLVAFAEPDTPSKVVVGLLEVQYEDAKESEEDRKEPPPVRHVNLRAAAADLGGMRAEVRTLKWTPGWREPLHGGGDEEGARGLAVRGDSLLVPPSLLAVGLFDGRIMLLRVTLADVRCSLKERPFGGMEDIRDGSSVVGTVPVTDRDSLSPSRGGFVRHRGAPSTALCIEHVAMLEGHTGPINCLDFAPFPLPFGPPFGLFLASGSADRSCRLWDLSKVLPNKGGLTKDEVANVKRRQRFGLPAFKQSSLATQQAADPDAKRGQLPFVQRAHVPRMRAGSQQETVRVRERDDYLMGSSQLSRETQAREIPTVSIQSDNAREEAEALSIRYCSCPGGPLGAQVSQEIRADGSPLRFPLTTPVTLGRPEILRQPSPLSLGPGPILSPPHRHSSSPPERPSPLCESLDCKCCPRRASTPAGASVHETLGRETVGKRGFSGCNTEEGGIRKRSTSVSSVLVPIQPSNDPNNENSRTDDRQPQSRGTSPPASRIGDGPAPQPLPRDGQRLKSESALPIQGTQQTGDALSSLSVSKEEEEMDVEVISVSESSRRSENTHTRVEMETMAEEAAASAIDAVLGFPSSHPLWQTRDPPPSSPPSRPFRKETGSNSKEGQEEKPPQPKSLVNPDHQEKTQQDDIEEEKGTDMPPPFPLPPSRRSSIRGPKSPQLPHPVERPDWKTNGQRQQTESQGGKGDGDEESRSSSERPPFIFSPTVDGGDAGMPAEASLTLSFSAQGSQSELDDSSTLLALCTDFVKNAVATATAKALAEGLLPGLHPDRQQASEGIVGREGETGPAHLPGGGQPAGLGANLSGQRTEQETGTPNPFPVSQRPETEASVSPSVSTKHHKAERSPALSVQGSQASTETREVVSAVSADFLRSLFADAAMQALTQALPATLTAESSRRQPEDAAPPPSSSHPSRPERQPQTLEQTLPQAPGGQNAAGLSRNTETQTEKKQKKKIKRLILPAADANDGTDTAGSAVEAGTTHATALPLQQDQGLQTERRIGRGPSRLSSGRPGERKEEGYGPKSSKPAVLFNEDEGDKEGGGTAVAIVQTESRSRAQTVRVVDSDGARRSVEGTRLVHKLVEGGRETDRDDSHSGPHTTAADRGVQTRGARLKPVSRGEVGDLPGQGGTVGGEMEQGTQTRSKRRTPRPRQANGDKDTVLSVMALYERALEEAQKAAAESNTQ
uniref:Uncharacterized protein n=1 Tax=Chromera velia CCMP2878 TaxID=1169474 RepID=A0A0G4GPY1_9ALVE|eukprot:Cvel_22871.t1-p1 / transcript=Cvel_22871.t1 / gene=Cvel_22871 / organism=Chromera_velia_CCMP2878 / gene_product=hypothetical protein / transcript_product=hypothetical protein / location=Cvel_scaffold2296:4964-17153(+) / protein_length=1598 / sequence_SO=supercontig / SO=protein_coding / is_pseudo=false